MLAEKNSEQKPPGFRMVSKQPWFYGLSYFFSINICHDLRSNLFFPLETLLDTHDTRDEVHVFGKKCYFLWNHPTNLGTVHISSSRKMGRYNFMVERGV